jgi:Putative adhesin
MKTFSLFFALFCFSLVSFNTKNDDDKKPYLTKNFGNNVKALHVRTSGGSITVAGEAGEARVEVYISANNWNGSSLDKEEIESRLKEYYELNIKQDGDKLICEAKRKNDDWNNWKKGLSISFKIWVPEKTTTNLATSGGSINLKKLLGSQTFSTSGGSLNIKELGGDIKGKTSGGSISVSNSYDNIDLSTSGGSIQAQDCKGTLKLSTSGGSIRLKNLTGTLLAHTSGGSINADMTSLGESVDLHTSGGSIHATMPLTGGISLDIRGSRVQVGALNNFSGKVEKTYVRGTINGGGKSVKMSTSGGSVYVNEGR